MCTLHLVRISKREKTSSEYRRFARFDVLVGSDREKLIKPIKKPVSMILQSENGSELANKIIIEMTSMWTGIKIVHGKP